MIGNQLIVFYATKAESAPPYVQGVRQLLRQRIISTHVLRRTQRNVGFQTYKPSLLTWNVWILLRVFLQPWNLNS
jgi:hypothetical protein